MLGRRDLFKLGMGAALAQGAEGHKFFTNDEFAMVDELTEIIIPADEKSGGAKAAKVAAYIDQRLAEAFDAADRDTWRKQLAIVDDASRRAHQQSFLKCDPAQRIATVEGMQEQAFFSTLKAATIHGYYTSRIGIHDDMGYLGNTYQQGDYAGFLPPHAAFPSDPKNRLAVASWPFRKLVNQNNGTLPLLDFPKMVMDRFDVHAIEPLDEHFPSTDPAYLDQFRAALDKVGSRVVNIPVGRLGGSFYDADEERRGHAIATAKHWVDVAATVGSPGIRVHVASAKNPPDVRMAAESLKQVAEYGESKNVVVHLENDDPKSEEAFFLVNVIESAKTPWLRALPDFCNSMLLERGDDYNYQAVAAMFRHAYAICHVKDSEQDGKKLFRVDLQRTLEMAVEYGYRGYFSMEYDADGDPFEPTSALVQASVGFLRSKN